jgi:ATP-dependent exoDNAse (exonuclease V) beta subunit
VAALDCSRPAEAEFTTALAGAHDQVQQPSWSVTSVTAEAHHIARMTRAADATADDPTKVVSAATSAHRADAGMAWGTLIHGLLEHAMRHKSGKPEDLRRLAVWLTVEEPQLRSVIDEALETVERVRHKDFWRSATAAEHSEETPFTFATDRRVTNGVIDLVHRGPEGWRVTDYKTDTDGGVLNQAAYQVQTARYRQALEACGLKVETVALEPVRDAPVAMKS